jgi:uncharacterized protein (DUF302 family)
MKHSSLIVCRSRLSVDEVCARISPIAQKHGFGVLGEHDLRRKMEAKGVAFGRECRVLEVCNPAQAKAVLDQAMEVATALPCRIAVYREGEETVLATIKPTALFGMFDAAGAAEVAGNVESVMAAIMEEAAR